MIRLLYKALLIIVFVVYVTVDMHGQSVCADKLTQAKQLFESGQIEQIPLLLDSCLERGFAREDQLVAYQLLIQTYLFDYNQAKADETMTRFLKEFPTYKVQESDPAEIKELFDSYESFPVWSFELMAGANMSHIITNQYYSTYNLQELERSDNIKFGFHAGLQASRYFGKHFGVSLGVKYINSSYQHTESVNETNKQSKITENTSWIGVPLSGQWYIISGKTMTPFLFLGAEAGYILESKADFRVKFDAAGQPTIVKGSDAGMAQVRNRIQYGVTGGLGVKCKFTKGTFKLWAGYTYNLNSFPKSSRYEDMDKILNYQHVDDRFAYNHIYITASYSLDLYRIRKK